jgi:hypothetical protein
MIGGTGSALILGWLASAPTPASACWTGDAAIAQLRAVHETARRAHLEGNADLLAPGTAEQMVLVSNGEVLANTRDGTIGFFKGYFARVKYLEWSDSAPPVIRVSPDGKMGWMAVKVRARYLDRTKPDAGEKAFRSSWIATYERVDCDWKMTGNASAVVNE